MPVEYFTESVPTRNERNIWVEIVGAVSSQKRRLPYIGADIPMPTQSERLPVFVQGPLVAVHRGNDVIPTGSLNLPFGAFMDPSEPTLDEIIAGTGEGANWTPTNDTITVRVDASFRLFTVRFHDDARSMSSSSALSGSYTTRTLTGVLLEKAPSASVAAPIAYAYTLQVYGTITDAYVVL